MIIYKPDSLCLSSVNKSISLKNKSFIIQRTLTIGRSMTVRLTSYLTGLDLSKEVKPVLIKHSQSRRTQTNKQEPAVQWYFPLIKRLLSRLSAPFCHLPGKINAMGTFFSTWHLCLLSKWPTIMEIVITIMLDSWFKKELKIPEI